MKLELHRIESPALLLRRRVLQANLERMAVFVASRGLALRPHVKTHKTPEIARLQMASGACGITVAKVGEAEVMVQAGISDLCIATQIVSSGKLRRLMQLARGTRISLVIDSEVGAQAANETARDAEIVLPVLLEVDTGQHRCGVADIPRARRLARFIATQRSLELVGVLTHEGHVYQCRTRDELKEASVRAAQDLVAMADALRADGHDIRTVSAGSAVSAFSGTSVAGLTEFRPGTYVFNDMRQVSLGACTLDECAISVLATVISAPREDAVVLDTGSKSIYAEALPAPFSFDYSGYGWVKQYPEARIVSLSEEHAVVQLARGARAPRIGERVEIIPNHVCTSVNLHEQLCVIEDEQMVDVWRIAARGRIR